MASATTRKSSRGRKSSESKKACTPAKPTNVPDVSDPVAKRRKLNDVVDDKIDPVEKLLSYTCVNADFLLQMEAVSDPQPLAAPVYPNISCNFAQVINDNLRSYYATFCKSQMEIHNDHSSFSVLTRPHTAPEPAELAPRAHVPFFKNVNFNPTASLGNFFEDYIHYDGEDTDPVTPEAEPEETLAPLSKMSFHYRQNDHLNLSLSDEPVKSSSGPDVLRFLNQRSVISGKASEMIGTSKFLISDFFS